jgi:hypothetical protein
MHWTYIDRSGTYVEPDRLGIQDPVTCSDTASSGEVALMTPNASLRCNRCGARLAQDNSNGRCAPCQAADRDRVARASDVPIEFWSDETLQQALAIRHMGRVIRAYPSRSRSGETPRVTSGVMT